MTNPFNKFDKLFLVVCCAPASYYNVHPCEGGRVLLLLLARCNPLIAPDLTSLPSLLIGK